MSSIDREQAKEFLQYLAGVPDAAFQFRTITIGGSAYNHQGTFAGCFDILARRNAAGADVYVIINETNGGRCAEDVVAVRALFVDLDTVLEGAALADRKARLDYFNSIAPVSVTIETSPGKYHMYWFTHGFELDRFTPFQKALIEISGSDPVIHDLPRIMRVPGFVHQKTGFLSRLAHVAESVGRRRKAYYVLPATLELALAKTLKKFGPWNGGAPVIKQTKAKSTKSAKTPLSEPATERPQLQLPLGSPLSAIEQPARHDPIPPNPPSAGGRREALGALANAADLVRNAPAGDRNNMLNREGFGIARFVESGALTELEFVGVFKQAARDAGLDDPEINSTLGSALKGRERRPRAANAKGNGAHKAPVPNNDEGETPRRNGPPSGSEDQFALDFIERHAKDLRYSALYGKWLKFGGGRWAHETTLAAFDLARKICREGTPTKEINQ